MPARRAAARVSSTGVRVLGRGAVGAGLAVGRGGSLCLGLVVGIGLVVGRTFDAGWRRGGGRTPGAWFDRLPELYA